MSGIILGPGIIGEEASKLAQRTAVDDAGGGAIQVGPGILSSKKFGKNRAAAAPTAATTAAATAPIPPAAPPAVPTAPTAPVREEVVGSVDANAPGAGLSEDDVEIMLAGDPNAWDIVAEAEAKRAEGWRPRVARMLLNAAKEAKAKPMPDEAIEHLMRIAEVGAASEAAKLAQAVGAAGSVGTGDPDAPSAKS